jgi:hypothetical protein
MNGFGDNHSFQSDNKAFPIFFEVWRQGTINVYQKSRIISRGSCSIDSRKMNVH